LPDCVGQRFADIGARFQPLEHGEGVTGAVLIAFGLRLATERR